MRSGWKDKLEVPDVLVDELIDVVGSLSLLRWMDLGKTAQMDINGSVVNLMFQCLEMEISHGKGWNWMVRLRRHHQKARPRPNKVPTTELESPLFW